MPSPLSPEALATLHRASARLQAWPTSTLWLACLACLPSGDTLTCAELDDALQDAGRIHDLMGADAVEAIGQLLAQGATIPAPAPTESQSPSGDPEDSTTKEAPADLSPEEHLRAALASLEAAIRGFGPCPGTHALEYNALDLRAALAALGFARALEAEKAAEAA